jgi:protease I
MTRALKNRRIAVLAADGFEKVELTIPVRAMKAAGAEVDIVSLRHGRIRGVNLHEPASRVRVTRMIEEASPGRYDALLVPGGFINPDLLRQSAAARDFVKAFDVARQTDRHALSRSMGAGIGRSACGPHAHLVAGRP